jgi:GDPmannose 4,6-dehydratase
MKKALIFGITGQDGAYLAKFLIEKRYQVYGVSRSSLDTSFTNLQLTGIYKNVILFNLDICEFNSVLNIISKIQPDEIYNLAGQSSVGVSFEQPLKTIESVINGTLNILESIRQLKFKIKFFNAGSGECFGDLGNVSAKEELAFNPINPYGVAKASAYSILNIYRSNYNIFSVTGILFNHESPLRGDNFVTKKIISTACRIYRGSDELLKLGNIDISRDWGWAPEYVEAMWLMLQNKNPNDYVIATGASRTLKEFIKITFEYLELNYLDHISVEKKLIRPSDTQYVSADPSKIQKDLGWKAKLNLENIVVEMIKFELSDNKTII